MKRGYFAIQHVVTTAGMAGLGIGLENSRWPHRALPGTHLGSPEGQTVHVIFFLTVHVIWSWIRK